MTKSSTKDIRKAGKTRRKTNSNVAVEKTRDTHRKAAPRKALPKVVVEKVGDAYRLTVAQFEKLRDAQVPSSLRGLAETNVAQTRELYERSKNAFQAVLESWQKSFGAAGQGSVAFNQKIMDIAERNINTGFDLAMRLAAAKNLAEAMELQAAYWRKQFGEMHAQAEEVRKLSTSLTADLAEPIKAQITRGMGQSTRRRFFE